MHADTIPETTIWAALENCSMNAGNRPVITESGVDWTFLQLKEASEKLAGRLTNRGIGRSSRVMTMLPNSIDHVILLLALSRLGAIWAAISPDQRGPSLDHMLVTVNPKLIIAVPEFAAILDSEDRLILFDQQTSRLVDMISDFGVDLPSSKGFPDDVRAIVFTSGTTGPPKGTLVTERMLMASAWGAAHAADVAAGDRFLLWEPLYHVGGSQMIILALLLPVRLFIVSRFSVSRFWQQVREHEITKLHYLGGVLEILLSQPTNPLDSGHAIKLGFGAGARPDVWRAFEDRFGIPLREVYGLTEASSFATLNLEGHVGSIGKPMPWFNISLVNEDGIEIPAGEVGEIVINPKVDGLLTPGYLGNPEATAALLRDGALYTGDLARGDGKAGFFFVGRHKDAIRRRGEIISAWEIETALMAHPDIAECAAIAVPATIGEEDILVFIRSANTDLPALVAWVAQTLPRRSQPRYWVQVDDFPRTSSARIAKTQLCPDTENAYDSENP